MSEKFRFTGESVFDSDTLLRAARGEKGAVPSFHLEAYNGGKMVPEGTVGECVVDLEASEIDAEMPVFLDHRKTGEWLVGHCDTDKRRDQLLADGLVSAATKAAAIVVNSAANGFKWKVSIGGEVLRKEKVNAGQRRVINGREHEGPFNHVKGYIYEISFVPLGADSTTRAAIAAMARNSDGGKKMPDTVTKKENDNASSGSKNDSLQAGQNGDKQYVQVGQELADWLTAKSVDPTTLEKSEAEAFQAAFDQEVAAETQRQNDATKVALLKELRATRSKEVLRCEQIADLCQHDAELHAKAVQEGWTVEKTELERFRKDSAKRPNSNRFSGSRELDDRCTEAAILAQVGVPLEWLDAKSEHWRSGKVRTGVRGYSEEELNKAVDAKSFSFTRLFHEFLASNRISCSPGLTTDEMIPKVKDLHRQLKAAGGFSGMDLSGILSNVMGKTLLQSFLGVRPVAQSISTSRPVSDFKQSKAYRLTGNGNFLPVGPTGELQVGQLQEEEFANQAETFGRIISVSRNMLVNDDLSALQGVSKILGRKANMVLQREFFSLWLGLQAANFFAAGNNNLLTTTPLDIAGLTAAETKFLQQTDADGDPIDTNAAILLVPPSLKTTADTLMSDVGTIMFAQGALGADQATGVQIPSGNPHQGKWRVEWSQWLENTGLTGYSVEDWYLIAPPSLVAAAEIVYLNGKQTPTIDAEDTDFSTLGFQWRAYFDFGIAAQDYRGAVKADAS